jgi:hypothetical protein
MSVMNSTYLTLIGFVTTKILSEYYKLISSTLCNSRFFIALGLKHHF